MANVSFIFVQCLNCNRSFRVPVRGRFTIPFCSLKCNKQYVAKEGAKAQEEQYYAGRNTAGFQK